MLKLLCDFKPDLEFSELNQITPLQQAIKEKELNSIKILLLAKAKTYYEDENKKDNSPIFMVV